MIRVADYIFKYLADQGVNTVFLLTGGGAMHLNDAAGREKRIHYICNQHEQASAMAAEGYARIKEKMAVVNVTTGPGGTNALTGVIGQWLDSIPVLYLSGQVRYDTTAASTGLNLRGLGDQEINIVDIVKPVTKYAVMVTDPNEIAYHLEKAIHIATSGRNGPVWLDIPLNVQASQVDETVLTHFRPPDEALLEPAPALIDQVVEKLQKAQRPLIIAGAGVRLAGAADDLLALAKKLQVPVQAAWDAIDLVPDDHPLYAGRPSTLGQRGANFIFQNCDLLISIGCRLNVRQIGYTFKAVARGAYKVSVDVDGDELKKPTVHIDLPIQADAGAFIRALMAKAPDVKTGQYGAWLGWCKERINKYPVVLPQYEQNLNVINPYVFSRKLSEHLNSEDVVVSSNGASCVIPIQAMVMRKGQRHVVNSGCAAMGYGLPAAIGACFAHDRQRVICLEGDGSIQMNIQELETVVYHRLPLKIFIFNNNGYLSIRTTQNSFFNGHLVGESQTSGVGFPDFCRVAEAYGLKAFRLDDPKTLDKDIESILSTPGPVLVDVMVDPQQLFMPRITSKKLPDGRMVSSPLEDMFPFLDDEEFLSNMIIPRWE